MLGVLELTYKCYKASVATSPDGQGGHVAGWLEKSTIRLSPSSLAGPGVELGNMPVKMIILFNYHQPPKGTGIQLNSN